MDRLLTIIEPVLYGDIFDFPVTLDEVHRFCRLPISTEQLRLALADEQGAGRIVDEVDGFYVLRGREALVDTRRRRTARSRRAQRRARTLMRFVKYVPFVRGSLMTGSTATDNARQRDDLDYLVLVHPGRMWLVFGVLGTLQRLGLGRVLCVNYYLSVDSLGLTEKSPYVARELLQALPLVGGDDVRKLYGDNGWIAEIYPNASSRQAQDAALETDDREGTARNLVERFEGLLGGDLGNALEVLLRRLLEHRLPAHYGKHGRQLPDEVRRRARDGEELRFHANDYPRTIADELDRRKERARSRLGRSRDPTS